MEFKLEYLNATILTFAAFKGYTEIVRELVSRKDIDINIKDI